jgi:hypothetical protein
MRPLPTETVRAVFAHGEEARRGELGTAATALRTHLKELNAAFNSRLFGDPQQVSLHAAALAKAVGAARPAIGEIVYTPDETRKLHAQLAARLTKLQSRKDGPPGDDGVYLDHDTAQQLAWGLLVLKQELGGKPDVADLDRVVALQVRPKVRQPVGVRLERRLNQLYQFQSADFFRASAGLLTGPGGK